MLLKQDFCDLETKNGLMRTHRFFPEDSGKFGSLILFSEIYQMTGPIARLAKFFAGHGYLVYVPEVYHEFETPGAVFAYNEKDTEKGNRYKKEKPIESFDEDCRVCIESLLNHSKSNGKIGSFGVCLGGHLSLRAGLFPEVSSIVSAYGTNIHDSSLGKEGDDTIQSLEKISAEILFIWGKQDPHVPKEGRKKIWSACDEASLTFSTHTFQAQHAFLRDEGYRYDPQIAKICLDLSLELFSRTLR